MVWYDVEYCTADGCRVNGRPGTAAVNKSRQSQSPRKAVQPPGERDQQHNDKDKCSTCSSQSSSGKFASCLPLADSKSAFPDVGLCTYRLQVATNLNDMFEMFN